MYKGYLFETRGKGVSLTTRVWGVLVKLLLKWNSPALYSFQGSLPRLPVPSVKETVDRYLKSVRPIYDDETFENVKKEAGEFENGISTKLQRYLVLKSWWADNFYSDWWEEYAYLKSREPLMYGSNYYGSDTIDPPTNNQAARAGNLVHLILYSTTTKHFLGYGTVSKVNENQPLMFHFRCSHYLPLGGLGSTKFAQDIAHPLSQQSFQFHELDSTAGSSLIHFFESD